MKQKTPRGLNRKAQKTVQSRKRICQSTLSENDSKKNSREADGRVPPIRFEYSKEAAELVGARELRRSPAAIHGEAGGSGSTSVFSAPFRVDGWWWWSPSSIVSATALAPADGSSGGRGPRRRVLRRTN